MICYCMPLMYYDRMILLDNTIGEISAFKAKISSQILEWLKEYPCDGFEIKDDGVAIWLDIKFLNPNHALLFKMTWL